MAKKISERAIGIVVAIVGIVLVAGAIYLTSSLGKGAHSDDPPASQVLGPETVDAQPNGAAHQTALNADPAAPAGATPSLSFESKFLSFNAVFPDAAPNDPVLTYLRKDAERYLTRIKANAEADAAARKAKGQPEGQPWEVDIAWTYTAKAGDIVSLSGSATEYTGGAHPTTVYDTHIARANGDQLRFDDMLKADRSPSPSVQIGVCAALKAAKKEKIGAETIFDDPIVCAGPDGNAKTEQAVVALAPSSDAGKFGGLYAYYGPYVVGPSVEGGYELTVQQEVFAADLRPEFKALFAGKAPALER